VSELKSPKFIIGEEGQGKRAGQEGIPLFEGNRIRAIEMHLKTMKLALPFS
jgi:hypothetical protein